MNPVVIPTFISLPVLAKHRFSAPSVDWAEVPKIIAGFKEERQQEERIIFSEESLSDRPADLAYLYKIHDLREGRRIFKDLIPQEQALSSLFELAIKEAVAIDKKIVFQAYLKMEREYAGPCAGLFFTLPVSLALFGKPDQVVRELAHNEANSQTLRRAIVSSLILEKVLEHRSQVSASSSVD